MNEKKGREMNCLEIEIWHSFLLLLISDTQTFPFFLACTLYKKNKLPCLDLPK